MAVWSTQCTTHGLPLIEQSEGDVATAWMSRHGRPLKDVSTQTITQSCLSSGGRSKSRSFPIVQSMVGGNPVHESSERQEIEVVQQTRAQAVHGFRGIQVHNGLSEWFMYNFTLSPR